MSMNIHTKMDLEAPTSQLTVKKTTMAITAILTCVMFSAASANAAPEVTINQQASGSTTIVEQSADGKVATITATPNGITMQDGMPFSVTQIASVPRYTVSQGTVQISPANQSSATVTSVPVTNQVTNKSTTVDVITIPGSTVNQALPVTTGNAPVLTTQAINNQSATTQIISTTSLDSLQLKPTFSTPGVVNAQTKIMKILKYSTGKEVAVPANHVAPGDVIEYHTTYTNTSAQPVNDVNAVVSLPNGVKLVSLNSPLPTFASMDGNSYQTVNLVGNTAVIQDSYSGLKWDLVNLDSNAAQTVIIRAKVQ